jgi:heme oxygenase (biliverdin-IX-beta and delta-forming)
VLLRISPPPTGGEPGGTSLAIRLREATAAAHQRTEASFGFRHIQQGTLTLQIYAQLLVRLRALYGPAERAVLAFLASTRDSLTYQAKSPRLADDLAALGVPPMPARERDLACGDAEHGVALLYVLECATLGGKIITTRVHAQLGPLVRDATTFFDPYGAALGARWLATRRFLDDVAGRHSLDEEMILRRAVQVFTWFGAGLDDDP